MVIRELSQWECLDTLAGARFGRLACAHDNQPYVVPVYFVLDRPTPDVSFLYGFTTPGQKVEWMRANPLVCVEWDEVEGHNQWVSVLAFGRYEELHDAPAGAAEAQHTSSPIRATSPLAAPPLGDSELGRERRRAFALLGERSTWWQPGDAVRLAHGRRNPSETINTLYYRVRINRVSGLRATPDATEVAERAGPASEGGGRVRKSVRGIAGKVLRWCRGRP